MDLSPDAQTVLAAAFVVIVVCLILIQVFFFSPQSQQLHLHQLIIIPNLQPWLNLSLAIKTLTSMREMNNPTNLFNSSLALCLLVTGQYLQVFNVFTQGQNQIRLSQVSSRNSGPNFWVLPVDGGLPGRGPCVLVPRPHAGEMDDHHLLLQHHLLQFHLQNDPREVCRQGPNCPGQA